jgi:hypothetical protein
MMKVRRSMSVRSSSDAHPLSIRSWWRHRSGSERLSTRSASTRRVSAKSRLAMNSSSCASSVSHAASRLVTNARKSQRNGSKSADVSEAKSMPVRALRKSSKESRRSAVRFQQLTAASNFVLVSWKE